MQLPAVANIEQAPELLRQLDAAIAAAAGGALRLDASALADFDTSAIALLLHARRAAAAAGVKLAIDGVPEQMLALARLYGVDSLVTTDVPALA